MKLWLDDERPAPDGWLHVTTPEEAIEFLGDGLIAEMSLDHDLGLSDDRTGYTVAAWLEEAVLVRGLVPPARITVHSANPVGRARMEQAIKKIQETTRSH
jgi:hypothetical protein